MRVLIVWKALVVGAYQRKLEVLASRPEIELACVVPPTWGAQHFEPAYVRGYRVIVRPIRFNGNFHLFHFRGLGGALRELRPDIVHVDEEPYNLATILAVRQALAVGARPIFFTWQNLVRRYPPPFRWFERYVYTRARHAIAGSADAGRVLRRKGYRGPLAVIPQVGVDADLFAPPRSRPPNPCFTIGYAGRLVEEKGLFVLLDALVGLDGDWQLRLVGDGPLRAPLLARARALRLAERVSLETSVPSTEMPATLQRFDALVLPSLTRRNWKEQFGRILVEAMACGVPVAGSASGEIPRVVGEAGLIVPEADPPALRAALHRLASDAAFRADLARRGRARVLDRFTHDHIADETLAVYQRTMRS